ncbi:MAG: hypothetical protein HY097_03115 [Nitrospinae bacterium]|nr:hypothetical protein [Nitrospinota bacterium]
MNQVIQNIVINAREAMTNGGVITISAENTMVSKMVNLPLKREFKRGWGLDFLYAIP